MAIPPMLVGDTQYRGAPILPDDSNSQEYSDLVFGAAPPAAPGAAPAAPVAAPDYSKLSQQLSGFWGQNKIDPTIKGINRADELAQILAHRGITDLSQLGLKTIQTEIPGQMVTSGGDSEQTFWQDPYTQSSYQLTYGDKTFGDLGGFDSKGRPVYLNTAPEEYLRRDGDNLFRIAGSAAGKGAVDYIAKFTPEGKLAGIVPQWQSSSDAGDIATILSFLAVPFTGGLSSTLGTVFGSQLAGQVAANALVQGTLGGLGAEASGGSFGKGFGKGALTGAVGGGLSSLASPYISQLGSAASEFVGGDTLGKFASGAVTGAAKSGIGALLSGGSLGEALATGALGGASGVGIGMAGDETRNLLGGLPKPIQDAAVAAITSGLAGRDPLQAALRAGFGSAATRSNFTYPGTEGATDDLLEGFFEPGGEGFVPTLELAPEEVQRETNSLLARYPAPGVPSDWFLGENVASGIPEWDFAAVKAGLPIGNLEQDFYVNERGQIVDSAGNVGTFVGDTFVPETGVTPDRTGYTPRPSAQPATKAPSSRPAPARAPAPSPAAKSDSSGLLSMLMAMGLLGGMGQRPQQEERNEFQAGPSSDLARLFGHTKEPVNMEQLLALTGRMPRG